MKETFGILAMVAAVVGLALQITTSADLAIIAWIVAFCLKTCETLSTTHKVG